MERENMVQCDADRINRILLIGSEGEKGSEGRKRKSYFGKAAAEAQLPVSFYDWKDLELLEQAEDIEKCIVKIDAPQWESCRLKELEELTKRYDEQLLRLSRLPFGDRKSVV